jgi:hypothetical protein
MMRSLSLYAHFACVHGVNSMSTPAIRVLLSVKIVVLNCYHVAVFWEGSGRLSLQQSRDTLDTSQLPNHTQWDWTLIRSGVLQLAHQYKVFDPTGSSRPKHNKLELEGVNGRHGS